jgi:glycosyltransferase involved in cell wall biosynthesis
MSRLVGRALSISGWDVDLAVRRMAHLVEAALLAQESARRGVKHIHAHFGLAPATIAWFASDIMNLGQSERVSWSFTIHGFHDFVDDAEARLDLKAAAAAFVVCISDFTKSQLCRITHPQYWDRFQVVRCGIDLEKFAFRGERALAGKPRIITVGRLAAEKGQLILLRAIAALRARGIEVELTLVGDGPLRGWIEGEISRLGLGDQVLLTGEVSAEEVNDYLLTADIFCLPSFSEGLPVAIMEAMAIGVPVVSTYIAGIPELAIDGKTALTVPAGNVEALTEALNRMITDDAFRKEAVRAAHTEVVQRHDRERNADHLASMLAAPGVLTR